MVLRAETRGTDMSAMSTEDGPTNVVQFVPAGKLRCYVTGKLRPDKPEEHVRQRWARSLVEEYGYDIKDLAVEL